MPARDVRVGRITWRVSDRFTPATETLRVRVISGPTRNPKALRALAHRLALDGRPGGCIVELRVSTTTIH